MLNARETKATLIKAAVVTSANVHDKHRQEKQLYGDSACAAQQELIRSTAPKAADLTNPRVRKGNATVKLERLIDRAKSRDRALKLRCDDEISPESALAPSSNTRWPMSGPCSALP